MAAWILLTVLAQFINAIVALVDKYILTSRTIPRPVAYAFYLSILSALSIIIFFFSWVPIPLEGVSIPSIDNIEPPTFSVLWISLAAGVALFVALVSLFAAFKRADASDVIPVAGASSAVGALLLSHALLDASLTHNFLWGFLLLVAGTFVLSRYRFTPRVLLLSIVAGSLFAVHFVGLKALFGETGFDNAFFWSRMGIVATAALVFFLPFCRAQLHIHSKKARRRAGALVIGNKALAGLAGIMLLKAIELGDVSVVQALGGLQFAFLLGLTAVFGQKVSKICGERCGRDDLIQKTVAVGIIIAGFFVLFL